MWSYNIWPCYLVGLLGLVMEDQEEDSLVHSVLKSVINFDAFWRFWAFEVDLDENRELMFSFRSVV